MEKTNLNNMITKTGDYEEKTIEKVSQAKDDAEFYRAKNFDAFDKTVTDVLHDILNDVNQGVK